MAGDSQADTLLLARPQELCMPTSRCGVGPPKQVDQPHQILWNTKARAFHFQPSGVWEKGDLNLGSQRRQPTGRNPHWGPAMTKTSCLWLSLFLLQQIHSPFLDLGLWFRLVVPAKAQDPKSLCSLLWPQMNSASWRTAVNSCPHNFPLGQS